MKIGIINDKEVLLQTNQLHFCDKIIVIDRDTIDRYRLRELLEQYLEEDLFAQSVSSFGLQLFECLPLFEQVFSREKGIRFLDKLGTDKLSDDEYFQFVLTLARNEKDIIVQQNLIKRRKKDELMNHKGRPSISSKKISKIKKLYTEDFKTMREIADICEVSLGTVFKYTSSN